MCAIRRSRPLSSHKAASEVEDPSDEPRPLKSSLVRWSQSVRWRAIQEPKAPQTLDLDGVEDDVRCRSTLRCPWRSPIAQVGKASRIKRVKFGGWLSCARPELCSSPLKAHAPRMGMVPPQEITSYPPHHTFLHFCTWFLSVRAGKPCCFSPTERRRPACISSHWQERMPQPGFSSGLRCNLY